MNETLYLQIEKGWFLTRDPRQFGEGVLPARQLFVATTTGPIEDDSVVNYILSEGKRYLGGNGPVLGDRFNKELHDLFKRVGKDRLTEIVNGEEITKELLVECAKEFGKNHPLANGAVHVSASLIPHILLEVIERVSAPTEWYEAQLHEPRLINFGLGHGFDIHLCGKELPDRNKVEPFVISGTTPLPSLRIEKSREYTWQEAKGGLDFIYGFLQSNRDQANDGTACAIQHQAIGVMEKFATLSEEASRDASMYLTVATRMSRQSAPLSARCARLLQAAPWMPFGNPSAGKANN